MTESLQNKLNEFKKDSNEISIIQDLMILLAVVEKEDLECGFMFNYDDEKHVVIPQATVGIYYKDMFITKYGVLPASICIATKEQSLLSIYLQKLQDKLYSLEK